MILERIRAARGIAAAVACLLLAACMLSPGKFTSELDIRKDGRFSFSYTGEIQMLALSKLAEMGNEASETFNATPCRTGDGIERDCTPREIADQKAAWENRRRARTEKQGQEADMMKAMLGGIDPTSPRAAEELVQRLRRQAGWRRVDYKGNGLFDVDFTISGRLDHDFAFPTIERFPMANAFVQIAVRADGTVRIDAPGFGPAASGEPWRQIMGAAALGRGKTSDAPPFPTADGTFTPRTDATVVANNTDEGPQADPAGQKLAWPVNVRSAAAPMALLRLQH